MEDWHHRPAEFTAGDLAGDLAGIEAHLQANVSFIVWLYGSVFILGFILLAAFTWRIQRKPLDWDEPVRRLAWRPWSLRSAAVIVLPLLAVQVLLGFAHAAFADRMPWSEPDGERALIIVQSLLFHWLCFALIAASLYLNRLPWGTAFGFSPKGIGREILWGVGIMIGVMPLLIGYNVVAQIVMNWMGYEPPVQDVTRIIHGASDVPTKVYFALLAVVIAPVVEELLFRGVLLPALTRYAGVKPAIVAVSVLFALVHGHLPSAVPLFILSAALSLAYIYRGSLVTSIAMHAFFNSMTIAVILRG
ncbi:MAG TPA: type II CAAX endopeptidase family protein [Kiritimatiellia bacterium]|nr:type II CAAX endopeptidase family protein [Kiritimatiellia bacterium]HMP34470.1 type II CAAX endopeptidase family protein [Kiritimatiellia bacterium]